MFQTEADERSCSNGQFEESDVFAEPFHERAEYVSFIKLKCYFFLNLNPDFTIKNKVIMVTRICVYRDFFSLWRVPRMFGLKIVFLSSAVDSYVFASGHIF